MYPRDRTLSRGLNPKKSDDLLPTTADAPAVFHDGGALRLVSFYGVCVRMVKGGIQMFSGTEQKQQFAFEIIPYNEKGGKVVDHTTSIDYSCVVYIRVWPIEPTPCSPPNI